MNEFHNFKALFPTVSMGIRLPVFTKNLEKTVKGPIFAQPYLSLENLHESTRSSVSPGSDF